MKIKRLVEDFQVEERIALSAGNGPFALYRLTKQSLGTLEAIDAVARRWNLAREDLAVAGMKDKHALTIQYVTIRGGLRRGLAQTNLELEYLGQAPRPIHARDISANRFVVVIRDLTATELQSAMQALAAASRDGLPNYFDNQRFGSLGTSGEFIAKLWCLGDYERALWLALADENVHAGREERDEQRILRDHWGDWQRCLQLLSRSSQRKIAAFLAHNPQDFRRAIGLVRQDLRSIWLAAFQSHLWNQVLAALIGQVCLPEHLRQHPIGRREVPFYQVLDDDQRRQLHNARLPLPSARLHLDDGPVKCLYDEVLAREGIELRQVRLKYPRDSYFSKGERPAVFSVGEFTHAAAVDELEPGRQKLTLGFTLPRGSYATILVKRVTGDSGDELAGDENAVT